MRQPISRRQHGFTDYGYAPLFAAAPFLLNFRGEQAAATLCWLCAGGIFVGSLFTRAEWGFVRVIPYKVHLVIDALNGLFVLTAPWLFGFAGNQVARNTFLVAGVFGILAGTLSRPEEMPAHAGTNRAGVADTLAR